MWGLNPQPRDQHLYAPPTQRARCPRVKNFKLQNVFQVKMETPKNPSCVCCKLEVSSVATSRDNCLKL